MLAALFCLANDYRSSLIVSYSLLILGILFAFGALLSSSIQTARARGPHLRSTRKDWASLGAILLFARFVSIPNIDAARDRLDTKTVHEEVRTIADAFRRSRSLTGRLPLAAHTASEFTQRRFPNLESTLPTIDPWGYPYHVVVHDNEFIVWSIGSDGTRAPRWTRGGILPWTTTEDVVFYSYDACHSFWRYTGESTDDFTSCPRTEISPSLLVAP